LGNIFQAGTQFEGFFKLSNGETRWVICREKAIWFPAVGSATQPDGRHKLGISRNRVLPLAFEGTTLYQTLPTLEGHFSPQRLFGEELSKSKLFSHRKHSAA
jgi:hypothetical protein